MKKKLITLLLTVLAVVMLCQTAASASVVASAEAEDPYGVAPCWNNTNMCTFDFAVLDPGIAYVEALYSAEEQYFTCAKITVKIQKRFMGIFWKTVDIGMTDNEWVTYSFERDHQFTHSFTVDGTGTYRALFTLEIEGTGGDTDVIEETMQSTYE